MVWNLKNKGNNKVFYIKYIAIIWVERRPPVRGAAESYVGILGERAREGAGGRGRARPLWVDLQ